MTVAVQLPGNVEVLQLVAQGLSYSQVAAKTGRSRSAVCGVVMREKARRARAEAQAAEEAQMRAAPTAPRRFSWEQHA